MHVENFILGTYEVYETKFPTPCFYSQLKLELDFILMYFSTHISYSLSLECCFVAINVIIIVIV